MLKKCPDCKKEISSNALKCPNCGHLFTNKIEKIAIVIIFIVVLIVGLFIYNDDQNQRIKRMQQLKQAQEQLDGN